MVDLARRSNQAYEVPKILEAATCILMEHVVTGQRLYNDSPWTFIRCQENIDSLQLAAGGFADAGLPLDLLYYWDHEDCGVGCLRKFCL